MKILTLPCLLLAAALAAQPQIVNSFDAPDTGIGGLAWAEGSLYAVSSVSNTVYRLDPATGAVQGSFAAGQSGANGLGYAGSLLYLTNGTSNVYKYTTTGVSQGATSLYCSS